MSNISLQLAKQGLLGEVVEDSISFFDKLGKPSCQHSEVECYIESVLEWATRVADCFESLEHSMVYLNNYKANKCYREAGIGRSHHINYHYFTYVIRVVTLLDIGLILTNKVFRLGIPEKECRFDSICNNDWVRSTIVVEALKKLKQVVEPWCQPRNLFVHRGQQLQSEAVVRLSCVDALIQTGHSAEDINPGHVRQVHRSGISQILRKFQGTEMTLFNATNELLSGLLPIYTSRRDVLRQNR